MLTYYQILGVPNTATTKEILSAYYKEAVKAHPDRHMEKSAQERDFYTEQFKVIAHAKDVLSDPHKRAEYDRTLVGQKSKPPVSQKPSFRQETKQQATDHKEKVSSRWSDPQNEFGVSTQQLRDYLAGEIKKIDLVRDDGNRRQQSLADMIIGIVNAPYVTVTREDNMRLLSIAFILYEKNVLDPKGALSQIIRSHPAFRKEITPLPFYDMLRSKGSDGSVSVPVGVSVSRLVESIKAAFSTLRNPPTQPPPNTNHRPQ